MSKNQKNINLDAYIGDEDCLFLNIWVPKNASINNLLPVLLFVHGGAFVFGAGSYFDGKKLASEQNVVVVTINYRLGPFGFFILPNNNEGSNLKDGTGSGNMGILDQNIAFQWARRQ